MLTGDAKRTYQREYMRKKRAGGPTRKPKREWKPTEQMLRFIKAHDPNRRYRRLRGRWKEIMQGLDTRTEEGMAEAIRRYRISRLTYGTYC